MHNAHSSSSLRTHSYFFARWRTRLPDAHTHTHRLARQPRQAAASRTRTIRRATCSTPRRAARMPPATLLAGYGAKRCCSSKYSLLQHCFTMHHTTHKRAARAHSPGKCQRFRPRISTQRSLLPLAAVLCSLLCSALTMMWYDAMLAARFVAQRRSRADHLPRRGFCARLQAQVHRLLVRAHCLLLPARQQTSHTTSGSFMHGSHHPPHPSSCSASAR